MTSWGHDPDAAASSLILSAVGDDLDLGNRSLLASTDDVLRQSLPACCEAVLWNRRTTSSVIASPDPPPGPFTSAALRLPKSRDEQIMTAHQCLGALGPAGRLYVYGGNSEGIRTFQKTLSALGHVTVIATRGHGRILELSRSDVTGELKNSYLAWRQMLEEPDQWVTYPGLFAAGAADPGTALLVDNLPAIAEDAQVLDYGCGPGAISAALRRRHPNLRLALLDNDCIAIAAARENVPDAAYHLGARIDTHGAARFDLIVSNPPLHVGFREDLTPLHQLISDAPKVLKESGALMLVVQRRIALDRMLAGSFSNVEIVADDGRYRVWRSSGLSVKRQPSASQRQQ